MNSRIGLYLSRRIATICSVACLSFTPVSPAVAGEVDILDLLPVVLGTVVARKSCSDGVYASCSNETGCRAINGIFENDQCQPKPLGRSLAEQTAGDWSAETAFNNGSFFNYLSFDIGSLAIIPSSSDYQLSGLSRPTPGYGDLAPNPVLVSFDSENDDWFILDFWGTDIKKISALEIAQTSENQFDGCEFVLNYPDLTYLDGVCNPVRLRRYGSRPSFIRTITNLLQDAAGYVAALFQSAQGGNVAKHIADNRPTINRITNLRNLKTPLRTPIAITTPLNMVSTNAAIVQVQGTVVETINLDRVTLNGTPITPAAGAFARDLQTEDGVNIITAVADYGRRSYTTEVTFEVDNERPSVVSASSAGSSSVLLQFNEAMHADIVADTAHFNIVRSSNNSPLPVTSAVFSDGTHTTVLLQTGLQDNTEYIITAVGVNDVAGNPISEPIPEVLFSLASATFVGTPPTGNEVVDSDEDGLLDHVEMAGWTVIIHRTDGTTETLQVSSDPSKTDTDNDGVSDAEERHGGMDPRNSDTDGDTLSDDAEWNRIYSDPTHQDTDGDGIQDGFEFLFFKTSPILADTDGDQIDDPAELAAGNRDPLIADLPSPDISVGNVNLQLNTTFTVTNEEGSTRSESKQNSATLTQAEDQSYSTSNETSTLNTVAKSEQITHSINVEAEVGFDDGFSASSKVSYGYENQKTTSTGSERGSSQQFGEESSQSAEEQYHESLETSLEKAVTETLTRDIISSSMKVDLTIDNAGDIPFTISNIELSAQAQDPTNRRRIIPIASLVPENISLGSVNIGALGDPARGPFVFTTGTDSVFPQEIEELMKNPRGLIIQLANFDIIDQDGNNFAFTSQQVLDRTAGITFDLGDGQVERYRVATASEHDPNTGQPLGITMAHALKIIGLNRFVSIADGGNGIAESTAGGDDVQIVLPSRPVGGNAIEPAVTIIEAGPDGEIDPATIVGGDDTIMVPDYETAAFSESAYIKDGGNGIVETTLSGDDTLSSRISGNTIDAEGVILRDGPNKSIDSVPGGDDQLVASTRERQVLVRYKDAETTAQDNQIKFWVVFSSSSTDGINFDDIVLRSGEQYDFTFVQDKDRDDVWAREEYLHGSSDETPNSDADLLTDFAEINEGWLVHLKSSPQGYRVYPNPVQADSDRDGLDDDVEFACGLDPRQRDTDLDGLSDREEIYGLRISGITESPMLSIDPDGENDPFMITRYLGTDFPNPIPHRPILTPVWAEHNLSAECIAIVGVEGYATDPLSSDTDGDFVSDLDELNVGLHPNDRNDGDSFLDDDGDGLPNSFENQPRSITINGVLVSSFMLNGELVPITSDPNKTDSDDDKLPDLLEDYLGSNPLDPDTDGDGILDTDEYKNGGAVCIGDPQDNCLTFLNKPDRDYNAFVAACDLAPACDLSVIEGAGSFGLGNEQQRGTNLNDEDTDGDGYDDRSELNPVDAYGSLTNPLVRDSDGDGLIDGAEVYTYGSNPDTKFTDTDDVIFSDGQEVAVGRNPIVNDKRISVSIYDGFHNVNAPGGTPDLNTSVSKNDVVVPLGSACTYNLFTNIDRDRNHFPATWKDCLILDQAIVTEGETGYKIFHDGTFTYLTLSAVTTPCEAKFTTFSYASNTDGSDVDSDASGVNRVTCGPNYNFNTIYRVTVGP